MKIKSNGVMVIPVILTINPRTHRKTYSAIAQKLADIPMARFLVDMLENGANPDLDSNEDEIDMSKLVEDI
jgi:hypothetical protein